MKKKRGYGAGIIYLYFFSIYLVGKGCEKGLSKGGIAHELSHIEIFKKWGFWKSTLLSFLQFFSANIRKKIESGADINAIKKGYGKELYQARKKDLLQSNDKIQNLVKKYYLSLEEIKKQSN